MDAHTQIVGYEALRDWFGAWPSFHDAEVLSMRFDRDATLYPPGPKLEACIHVFEPVLGASPALSERSRKHAIATIEFDGLESLEFHGFNQQNVIQALDLDLTHNIDGSLLLAVRFRPEHGVDCSLTCRSAVLVSVRPGPPSTGVYA